MFEMWKKIIEIIVLIILLVLVSLISYSKGKSDNYEEGFNKCQEFYNIED